MTNTMERNTATPQPVPLPERRPIHPDTAEVRIDELSRSVRGNYATLPAQEVLDELVELHGSMLAEHPHLARKAEQAFLFALRDDPDVLDKEHVRAFIAEYINDTLFESCEWESPEEVISISEALYGLHYDDAITADEITRHVRDLMRASLRYLEKQHRYEEMYDLLEREPLPPAMMDAELVRLQSRLHLYEMRRVRQKRRLLYGYLALQVLLVFLVFPALFIQFENGAIQQQIAQATNLDLGNEPRQFLSFADGLYWSIITSASVGYGDITPGSDGGKFLAAVAGVMGVLTVGVIAGLVLNWVTPRQLSN